MHGRSRYRRSTRAGQKGHEHGRTGAVRRATTTVVRVLPETAGLQVSECVCDCKERRLGTSSFVIQDLSPESGCLAVGKKNSSSEVAGPGNVCGNARHAEVGLSARCKLGAGARLGFLFSNLWWPRIFV